MLCHYYGDTSWDYYLLKEEILQILQKLLKNTSGNRCNGRWTLQNFMNLNLRNPDMLKMECRNIGIYVGNDDESRELSLRCFKSRDQSNFQNKLLFNKIA